MSLCSEHLTMVQTITFWTVTPSNLDLNIQGNILPLIFRIDLGGHTFFLVRTTQFQNPEDYDINTYSCERLKFLSMVLVTIDFAGPND